MALRLPCYCSVCLLDTFEDDYRNTVSGSLQTSKTRKQHEINDAKREKRAAMQTAHVEAQIMATTLVDQGAGPSSVIRPRDSMSDYMDGALPEVEVCFRVLRDGRIVMGSTGPSDCLTV